ncbi:zinc-binding alcohol dehydrogenase family protein [Steroidobacter sp. S1-65]|uniref:Zinc-type alcohol dehydrogenase-like protein n=1 Tax=Steroidobacter gossypii TaxID=2805490 RepID=A0ABS1WVP5_9GAMM|nr:zinc-binding alcohol dehydrogenase family protein [Steroidobacter gossypii]MBM0105033.1 zinc-binding alcohol dehydrogenase family protein [Steroidobacter gossypii]
MKAIVYSQHGLPPEDSRSLHEIELPQPRPGPRDLLVGIRAISVNPVDTKVRTNAPTQAPRVLGWDAVGIVEAIGERVSLFKPGDRVFYAGSIDRPGANAEYHLVDERIAAHAPTTLNDAQAAALPLTSITAWELLFDRLGIAEGGGDGDTLLIIGAAGGVGSILTQLARQLTRLTVIGTASRSQSQEWVKELGAHRVIDHNRPLAPQLQEIGIPQIQYVASLTHTSTYYPQLIEILAPQGKLALIDDPASLDAVPLKRKAISLHWELMFTRSTFQTPDMIRQHDLLERIANLIDAGTLRTTVSEHFGAITAENLRRAHGLIESHQARGKIVLEGF